MADVLTEAEVAAYVRMAEDGDLYAPGALALAASLARLRADLARLRAVEQAARDAERVLRHYVELGAPKITEAVHERLRAALVEAEMEREAGGR